MSKDFSSILKVKPYPPSSESVSIGNNTPSTSWQNEENPDISNALWIANEIIETASLNVSRTVKDLVVEPKEAKAIRNVNIPFEKTIYRDLVELSIHDEDLKNIKTVTIPRKNMPLKTKDTIPSIGDYRETHYQVPFVYEAKSNPPAKQMIRNYNGKEMYELFSKFRSSNF